ncbi:MAG TPA: lysophospholipid acyltransferase family protein [Acidimicrobiia bacterium]
MTFYRFARALVLSPFKLLFRVKVVGRERVPRRGAYIVAPSHRSIFDVPFAAFVTRRRIRMMAKRELFSTRFGRWLFTKLGAIEVEREGADRAALRASQAALEAGEPLAVFPEGTRRTGPVIEDLYDGVAYLALKVGVPILPVGVGGTEEILPSGTALPRIHKVAVVVGTPIVTVRTDRVRRRTDLARVTAELQAELQRCFSEAQRLAGAARPDDASRAEARQHV